MPQWRQRVENSFANRVKELAANLPQIKSLVLTPDLLAPVLARLGGGFDAATEPVTGTPA